MIKKFFISLAVLFVITTVVLYIMGKISWKNYKKSLEGNLRGAQRRSTEKVNLKKISDLPEPVKKYFKLVLNDGAPIIDRAYIVQAGGFRIKPDMDGWLSMKAVQVFTNKKPGFTWTASIDMAPFLSVEVIDSYINNKAAMRGKILNLFDVVDEKNSKELRAGALQRYLAESVWFPTSLLPSQGVKWEEIDKNTAKATIKDGDTTVSLNFKFDKDGKIVESYTLKRPMEKDGSYRDMPWRGFYKNYRDIDGYLIPAYAEVQWELPEGIYKYFKADLTRIEFN